MHRNKLRSIVAMLVAAFALSAAGSANASVPNAAKQWMITPIANTGQILGSHSYTLTNDNSASAFTYGYRHFGADLVWGGGSDWQFVRRNARDHRSIRPNENVALYNTRNHRYLGWTTQTFGIDLDWFQYPSYEWQVYDSQDNQGNVRDAIYNIDTGGYLVYQSRTWGINLGWLNGISPAADF